MRTPFRVGIGFVALLLLGVAGLFIWQALVDRTDEEAAERAQGAAAALRLPGESIPCEGLHGGSINAAPDARCSQVDGAGRAVVDPIADDLAGQTEAAGLEVVDLSCSFTGDARGCLVTGRASGSQAVQAEAEHGVQVSVYPRLSETPPIRADAVDIAVSPY